MPGSTEVNPSRRTFLKGAAGVASGTVFAELAGLGVDMSALAAKAGDVPIKRGKEVASICPYCSVGCGQIVMVETRPRGRSSTSRGTPIPRSARAPSARKGPPPTSSP